MAADKKKPKPEKSISDLEMLDDIRNKLYDDFNDNFPKKKVGELVKVIQLKNKLTVTKKSRKNLWDMVEDVRREKFGGKSEEKAGTTAPKNGEKKD